MRVSHLLAAAVLASACAVEAAPPQKPTTSQKAVATDQKSSRPKVNTEALILQDFRARVDKYVELHKQVAKGAPPLKETNDPAQIKTAQDGLAAKIRAARADASPGDILTAEIRNKLRRLMAPELKGQEGRDTKAVLKDDAPAPTDIPFKVNATYPPAAPLPTVPANLLANLPTLAAPLEYRIIGRHLILRDVEANIIVDFMLNAIS